MVDEPLKRRLTVIVWPISGSTTILGEVKVKGTRYEILVTIGKV